VPFLHHSIEASTLKIADSPVKKRQFDAADKENFDAQLPVVEVVKKEPQPTAPTIKPEEANQPLPKPVLNASFSSPSSIMRYVSYRHRVTLKAFGTGISALDLANVQEAFIRPVLGTMYHYRRALGDEFNIIQDKKILFFDGELVSTDLEAYITPEDFNLSTDNTARNLPLPLEELKEEFPWAIKKQSQKVAEARAIELLNQHGFWLGDDSDYEPCSLGSAEKQTLPPVQDHSKPATRSNRQRKHAMEESDEPLTSSQKET
jgi:hypothetical protein